MICSYADSHKQAVTLLVAVHERADRQAQGSLLVTLHSVSHSIKDSTIALIQIETWLSCIDRSQLP